MFLNVLMFLDGVQIHIYHIIISSSSRTIPPKSSKPPSLTGGREKQFRPCCKVQETRREKDMEGDHHKLGFKVMTI